jgi:hypothetical protein
MIGVGRYVMLFCGLQGLPACGERERDCFYCETFSSVTGNFLLTAINVMRRLAARKSEFLEQMMKPDVPHFKL